MFIERAITVNIFKLAAEDTEVCSFSTSPTVAALAVLVVTTSVTVSSAEKFSVPDEE
jgi:hypothetical protein